MGKAARLRRGRPVHVVFTDVDYERGFRAHGKGVAPTPPEGWVIGRAGLVHAEWDGRELAFTGDEKRSRERARPAPGSDRPGDPGAVDGKTGGGRAPVSGWLTGGAVHRRPQRSSGPIAEPESWTDQYDLGMEYTGFVDPGGYDQVVFRGDPATREFIACWVSDRRVLAAMNVNIWDVTDQIRDLVRSQRVVDLSKLADPNVPLSAL